MADVVDFPASTEKQAPPVWYDVAVCHHWNGEIQTWIKGTDPNAASNAKAIAAALRQVADGFDPPPEGW